VNGDKRRDLHRFGTAAMALVTVGLVVLHFTGREGDIETAKKDVANVYDAAWQRITKRVQELRGDLERWNGQQPYPPFSLVREKGDAPAAAGEAPEKLMVLFEEGCWVQTNSQDTNLPQEKELTLGGRTGKEQDFFQLLSSGRRKAVVEVTTALVNPESPDAPAVEVEVLLRKGSEKSLTGAEPLHATAAEARKVFPEESLPDPAKVPRSDLIFKVPPGSPEVRITCRIEFGGAQNQGGGSREIAIGILKTIPAKVQAGKVPKSPLGADPERPEDWQEGPVLAPARTVFVVGYVPISHFTGGLERDLGLDTPQWGERLYLTDAAGIVIEAKPDFPDKLKPRVATGRSWLSSHATQRIKMKADAGTDSYEGFNGDRVLGAFGSIPAIHGGIIVEREESLVLAPYRGLKAWHLAMGFFVILLLVPFVPPVLRRIREDTEIPRLLHHARKFVPYVVVIVVASTLAAVVQGLMAFQTKVVMDEVIVSRDADAYGRLTTICWLLAGLAVISFGLNWLKEYFGKVIQNRMVVEIRCVLSEKIAHLPMAFHARQRTGDLLSRIQNDVAETSRGLEMLFGDIISDPIALLVLTGSCFVINWRLALVVFIGLPVILVPVSYFGRLIKKSARKRQAKKADVTHAISQMLSGIRVVKAFRMEEHEAKRIREVSDSYLLEALRVARAQVTSKESLELFNYLSSAVILSLGGYLVLERQVTAGDLAAFTVVIAQMYRASKNLTTNFNKLQESLAGTERVFEVLDTPDTMADRPGARALVRPRREIAFENVSFRYVDDGPWVLRDVSLRVPVGTSLALVGATGAGKSTLLDLVARFYDPQEGRVLIDGMDIRGFSRDSLLSHVAVVTQEPFLFNASISENLRYGRPGASQTEIESAARAAFVHDEILKQAEGYETVVGERGSRLSGGQRQRVTIARAILKDPPILLLDEATSALDSRSERKVQEALENLMKDRTTFVIAHRLSTIQGVDRILVIDAGAVVEEGTHDELIRIPNGHYRHLYEIQFATALRRGDAAPPEDAAEAV